jgi:Rieske Fe-S protein
MIVLSLGWAVAAQAYSYGPACQWIRLYGAVEVPGGFESKGPIQLTISYQLPDQKKPVRLLTNVPLKQARFLFVLSGFETEIEGVVFVSPGFYFSKEIVFRYFARSSDGRWRSGVHESRFDPRRRQVDGEVLCEAAIALDTLVLR